LQRDRNMRTWVLLSAVGAASAFMAPNPLLAKGRAPATVSPRAARGGMQLNMALDPKQTIVVTGLGVMSGVGDGLDNFWDNIVAGKGSIAKVTHFDVDAYTCQIASQVPDFTPGDFFTAAKTAKSQDRFTHMAVGAARMAMDDAAIDVSKIDQDRFGVMVGSAFGGMATYEEQTLKLDKGGPKKVSPFTIPALLGNTASGVIGIELGARGPNFGVTSACAVGSHAIGEALNTLRRGDADVMIAGGSEAAITPLSFAGFCAMKAMNTQFNDNPGKVLLPSLRTQLPQRRRPDAPSRGGATAGRVGARRITRGAEWARVVRGTPPPPPLVLNGHAASLTPY
jgi:hypothetical protein